MNDLGNGIWATDRALELLPSLDTIIFDVDGVLLNVSRSFRQVISRATQHTLETELGWPGGGDYMRVEDTELFKRAGGFNSDWALTEAVVLLYLAKGVDAADRSAPALRGASPTLEAYTAAIGARGGGQDVAMAYLRETMPAETMERALALYNPERIQQVFMEMYAGRSHCQRVYGFEPSLVDQKIGELTKEEVILDTAALPTRFHYGVVTGRLRGELEVAMEMTGLGDRVAVEATMTADDGLHKPDPNGLIALAERMRPTVAAFVGDTLDDLRTVLNYHEVQESPAFLACQVLTGPAGEANRTFFAENGADIVAPDVNALVAWIAATQADTGGK